MAYCDYDEGIYKTGTLSEDKMWGVFSFALSNKSMHAASYKFGFLKAILDNLYNVDSELRLSFDQLFSKFAEIYWNLILKYHLRQNPGEKTTYLEQVLLTAKQKYQLQEEIPYESLTPSMMLDINHQVKIKCKNNVVGALFGDTQELFYSFSKKREWIQINPQMYTFVCRHKLIIEKLNYYEWAKYLEKVNTVSQSPYLLLKLDESTLRSNLSYYRNILHEEFECNTCFYCGKKLTDSNTHYDSNAEAYAEKTNTADMSVTYSRFLKYVPPKGKVIDIGCGSGRDLKLFSESRYIAEGIDASENLCKIARNYSNCKVNCSDFLSWNSDIQYDAIWANASLLHLKEGDILEFFNTKKQYVKDSGIIYFSMKKGIQEGFDSEGRYFTPYTDKLLGKILQDNKDLKIVDQWEENDSLQRSDFSWKCIILLKHLYKST